jgi:hypothetical protein
MFGPLVDEDDVVPGLSQIRADGCAIRSAAQDCDFFRHLQKPPNPNPLPHLIDPTFESPSHVADALPHPNSPIDLKLWI